MDGKTNGAAICNSNYSLSQHDIRAAGFRDLPMHVPALRQPHAGVPGHRLGEVLQPARSTSARSATSAWPSRRSATTSASRWPAIFQAHGNRFTRQWANDVRVWPMKLNALGYNGPDAVNRFYNNISWEKRKYPMYEHNHVPQADIDKCSGYLSRTASEIYFNTLYRSRKAAGSKDPYCGTLGGCVRPGRHDQAQPGHRAGSRRAVRPGCGTTSTTWAQARRTGLTVENNLVFRTWAEAGLVDTARLSCRPEKSPARDAATGRIGYIREDFFHRDRYAGGAADLVPCRAVTVQQRDNADYSRPGPCAARAAAGARR